MRFADRVVLVTGASRGLGAVLAARFAGEGATVAVHYRAQLKRANAVAEGIRSGGGQVSVHQADLGNTPSLSALVDEVIATHGRIDVLVNNAAIVQSGWFGHDDADAWDEVVHLNLVGVARLTRAVVQRMFVSGGGAVVNVASAVALRAGPGQSAYAASKGGLLTLTRTLGAELLPRGVRVNAVVPGVLDLGMADRIPREVRDRMIAASPAGRAGTADEVADAVLFLASDQARYIVGQALAVDGGLTL